MWSASLLSLAAVLSAATAALQGFNYGASFADNTPKHQADFEYEFNAAKQLHGTNGQFTSARIYTMIQSGTTNELIEAIPAAVNTHTTLLLGLWASGGPELFANEIAMLQKAVQLYGTAFTDLVVGISVGSEDLYRISPTGIKNLSGVGAGPDTLVSYIQLVRATIQTTGLARKPIGHVDTWTAYVNQSNNALIDAVDWIGVDAYPYFQTTMVNDIVSANKSFYDAYDYTVRVSLGKPVWVTETGWPVSGPSAFMAVASAENARIYWEDVSCSLISKGINLYYYTLQDVQMGAPSPSFGIMPGGDLSQVNPLFDLTCGANTVFSSSTASSTEILTRTESSILTASLLSLADSPILSLPTITSEPLPTSSASFLFTIIPGPISSLSEPNIIPAPTSWTEPTVIPEPVPSLTESPIIPVPTSLTEPAVVPTSASSLSEPTVIPVPNPIMPGFPMSAILSETQVSIFEIPPLATTAPAPAATAQAPVNVSGPHEAPHLIIPIENGSPNTVIGNSYIARVSTTQSTLFNFDIPAESAGKTCNLVFTLPENTNEWWAPYRMKAPGGITVSQLDTPATPTTNARNVGHLTPVGTIGQVQPGSGQIISSAPCAAGKTVGFQVDSLNGLELEYFQTLVPATGLWVTFS